MEWCSTPLPSSSNFNKVVNCLLYIMHLKKKVSNTSFMIQDTERQCLFLISVCLHNFSFVIVVQVGGRGPGVKDVLPPKILKPLIIPLQNKGLFVILGWYLYIYLSIFHSCIYLSICLSIRLLIYLYLPTCSASRWGISLVNKQTRWSRITIVLLK